MLEATITIDPRADYRRRLVLTTALCTGLLIATPAGAQVATTNLSGIGAATYDGSTFTITDGATVNIAAQSSGVIEWNGFNIPDQSRGVHFDHAGGESATPINVLNRVSGGASTINGHLSSDSNVGVYIINPNGVIFGSGANVNVGSLVASTLNVENDDFLNSEGGASDGTRNLTFKGGSLTDGRNGVTVAAGARLNVNGRGDLGNLVLIGGFVENSGTLNSQNSVINPNTGELEPNSGNEVALIAAHDVTLTLGQLGTGANGDPIRYEADAPIRIRLNEGTRLRAARIVNNTTGTINGRNVTVALANGRDLQNALLSIDGTITANTAQATDRGIMLIAGNHSTDVSGAPVDASGRRQGGVAYKDGKYEDILLFGRSAFQMHETADVRAAGSRGNVQIQSDDLTLPNTNPSFFRALPRASETLTLFQRAGNLDFRIFDLNPLIDPSQPGLGRGPTNYFKNLSVDVGGGGRIYFNAIDAVGNVNIANRGTGSGITLQSIKAGGTIILNALDGVISASDPALNLPNPVPVSSIEAGGLVSLVYTKLFANNITARSDVTLYGQQANTGSITSTIGNVILQGTAASGHVTVAGNITAGRNIWSKTFGDLNLQGSLVRAGRNILLESYGPSASINGGAGLLLQSSYTSTDTNLMIMSTGTINFHADSRIQAGTDASRTDVHLYTTALADDQARSWTFGDVTARSFLSAIDPRVNNNTPGSQYDFSTDEEQIPIPRKIRRPQDGGGPVPGYVAPTSNVVHGGPITFDALNLSQGGSFTSTNGAMRFGSVAIGSGNFTAHANGALTISGALQAPGHVDLTGSTITTQALTSSTGYVWANATAGALTVNGAITANGASIADPVSSDPSIPVDQISTIDLRAAGAITTQAITAANGDIDIDAGGALTLNDDVSGRGMLSLTGASVNGAGQDLTSSTDKVFVESKSGDLELADVWSGHEGTGAYQHSSIVLRYQGGGLDVGTLTARTAQNVGGTIWVNGVEGVNSGSASIGTIHAAQGIHLAADNNSLTVGDITSDLSSVYAQSVGNMVVGNVTAGGAANAAYDAGTITLRPLNGTLTTDSLTAANGDIYVRASRTAQQPDALTSITVNGTVLAGSDEDGSVTIASQGGDITLTGSVTANGPVISDPASGDNLGTIDLSAGGTITTQALTASTGDIDINGTGGVTVRGALIGLGDISVSNITSGLLSLVSAYSTGGNVTLDSAGAVSVTGLAQDGYGIHAAGAVLVQGLGVTIERGGLYSSAGSVTAWGTGGALSIAGDVSGQGAVELSGADVSAEDVTSIAGAITATSTGGNIALDTVNAAGTVSLQASGNVETADIVSGAAYDPNNILDETVLIRATNGYVDMGDITASAGDIEISAGGATANIDADERVGIKTGALASADSVTLEATSGNLLVESVSTTTDTAHVTLTTSNADGGRIEVGSINTWTGANSAVTITAAKHVTATGAIGAESVSIFAGAPQGDVENAITFTNINANSINLSAISGGNIVGTNFHTRDEVQPGEEDFPTYITSYVESSTGSIDIDSVRIGDLSLQSALGDIDIGTLAVSSASLLTGQGANNLADNSGGITIGTITQAGSSLNSGNGITLSAADHVTVTGRIDTGGHVSIQALKGPISTADIEAGSLTMIADVENVSAANAGDVTAGVITTSGNIEIAGSGDLTFGTAVLPASITSANGHVHLASGGNVSAAAILAGGAANAAPNQGTITIGANGTVRVGAVTASQLQNGTLTARGDIYISAGGSDQSVGIVTGALTAGQRIDLLANGGALTVNGDTSSTSGNVVLNARGNVGAGAISAGGSIAVTANVNGTNDSFTVNAGALNASAGIEVRASGNITLASATNSGTSASGDILLETEGLGQPTNPGAVTVTGNVDNSAGRVQIAAAGDISLNNVTAGGAYTGRLSEETIRLTSGGVIKAANVTASRGDMSISARGSGDETHGVDLGVVSARQGIDLLASADSISLASAASTSGRVSIQTFGGALTVTNANDLSNAISAGGGVLLRALGVTMGNDGGIFAGDNVSVNGMGGAVTLFDVTANGPHRSGSSDPTVTISTTGSVFVRDITASNGNVSVSGRGITAGDITAGTTLTLTADDNASTTDGHQISAGALIAGTGIGLTASGNITLASLNNTGAGDVTVTALGQAADTGLITINGTTTNSGGNVTIRARNALTLGTVSASSIDLESTNGGTIHFAALNGGTIDVDTAGAVGSSAQGAVRGTITQIGAGQVDVTGASVLLGAISTAATTNIEATGGNLTVGNITGTNGAGANVTLAASGIATTANIAGSVDADGNKTGSIGALTINAGTIAAGNLDADGLLSLTGHTGNIAFESARGTGATINALAGSVISTGALGGRTGAVTVTAEQGAITLGAVTGGAITFDTIADNNGVITANAGGGNISIASANGSAVTIDAWGTASATGLVTATGDVTVRAYDGNISLAAVSGGTVELNTLNRGNTDNPVSSGGDISFASLEGGTLIARARRDVGTSANRGSITQTGAGSVGVTGASVFLGAVSTAATTNVTARDGNLTVGNITGTNAGAGADVTLTADSGTVTTGNVTGAFDGNGNRTGSIGTFTIQAQSIAAGNIDAAGDINLDAVWQDGDGNPLYGNIDADDVVSTDGTLTIAGNIVTLEDIASAGEMNVGGQASLTLASATSTRTGNGAARLGLSSGGSLTVTGDVIGHGEVSITAGGTVNVRDVTGHNVTLSSSAENVTFDDVLAGAGGLNIEAFSGTVTGESAKATEVTTENGEQVTTYVGGAAIQAAGITVGTVEGNHVELQSTGNIAFNNISGNFIQLFAANNIAARGDGVNRITQTGSHLSGSGLYVSGTLDANNLPNGGGITIGTITAEGVAAIQNADGTIAVGNVTAGGIDLIGTTINADNLTALGAHASVYLEFASAEGIGNITADTLSLAGTGAFTQRAGSIVNVRALTGQAGSIRLDGANLIGEIGYLNTTGDIFINDSAGGLLLEGWQDPTFGIRSTSGNVDIRTRGGNLTIASGAVVSGENVTLSTDQFFQNLAGAGAVDADLTNDGSGDWRIYAAHYEGSNFNGLNSGNTAVWGTGPNGALPAGTSGNRYIFAHRPTVTVRSNDQRKTYGNAAAALTYTVTGLVTGQTAFSDDTEQAVLGTISLSSAGVGERASHTEGRAAYDVRIAYQELDPGYIYVIDEGEIQVDRRRVTATASVADKTYDGNARADGHYTFDDDLARSELSASAIFSFLAGNGRGAKDVDKAADGSINAKNVGFESRSVSGEQADNYIVTFADTNLRARINPLNINVTITAQDKEYDGTRDARAVAVASGILPEDGTIGVDGVFRFADANAGTHAVTFEGNPVLTGANADNYAVGSIAFGNQATISTRKVRVAGATANSRDYNGTTATTGTLGRIVDAVTGAEVIVAGENLGASGGEFNFETADAANGKRVRVTGIGLTCISGAACDIDNYELVGSVETEADIHRARLSVATSVIGKEYDGTRAANAQYGALGGTVYSQGGRQDQVYFERADATYYDKNAATGKDVRITEVRLAGAQAHNYVVEDYTVQGDITPRALTVAIAADNKTYDRTTAVVNGRIGSVTGVIAGDNVQVQGGTYSYADANAQAGKTVTGTSFDIIDTDGGNDAANYRIAGPATTAADILRRIVTANIAAGGKTYDGTTTAAGSVTGLNGVLEGDDVHGTGGTYAFADKNAGRGKTVTGTGFGLTGNDARNYAITAPATTIADILRKVVNASVMVSDKTYDGTRTGEGAASVDGIIRGDNAVLTGGLYTFADANAGADKEVSVSGLSLAGRDAGNYELVVPTMAFADILRRRVTVRAHNLAKETGTADPALTHVVVTGSLVAGDSFTGALTRAPGEDQGVYAILQGTLGLSDNYDLTYQAGRFTIADPGGRPLEPQGPDVDMSPPDLYQETELGGSAGALRNRRPPIVWTAPLDCRVDEEVEEDRQACLKISEAEGVGSLVPAA
jgi:filamentous hemagglutinin family protein